MAGLGLAGARQRHVWASSGHTVTLWQRQGSFFASEPGQGGAEAKQGQPGTEVVSMTPGLGHKRESTRSMVRGDHVG